jgi:hypothetical protein
MKSRYAEDPEFPLLKMMFNENCEDDGVKQKFAVAGNV